MPSAPKLPPIRPKAARPKGRTTAERGYGTEHEKQRDRLLKLYPICQRCGDAWSSHLHHKDRDPFNRDDANVEMLCEGCHQAEHSRR